MAAKQNFTRDSLILDPEPAVDRICERLRDALRKQLKRRGYVIGISGGIDSSVTAALCARAVGPGRVLALCMPERDSSPETMTFSELLIDHLGLDHVVEDITPILEAVDCHRRYEEAVKQVIPEFENGWKSKITSPEVFGRKGFTLFSLVAQSPDGDIVEKRLPFEPYLGIVAATNFKQRTRKMLEYYYADLRHFAVAGTPNRLEYDQGFFVKNGDGAADIKPIAHLFKSQVYQLAEYLGLPRQIIERPPSTDTYSLAQGQDEFYFALPLELLDLCLFAKNHDVSVSTAAKVTGLTAEQVTAVYNDIDVKRSTTRYLHLPALTVESIVGVASQSP